MAIKTKVILFCVAALIFATPVFSLDIPAFTEPVIDQAQILSNSEKVELENYLLTLHQETGIQLAVLTIPSLDEEDIESYGLKVARSWELGSKETNSGGLLLVSLKEREIRIEVGYGLEPTLTDTKCGLIIRNVITPYFRNGDYGTGIIQGIKNMAGIVTSDETLIDKSVAKGKDSKNEAAIVSVTFFGVYLTIIMIIIMNSKKRNKSGKKPIISAMPSFGNTGSSFKNFSNRSGGFGGGFGGGSFRGGGGGSFGGGGASGKW